MKRNRMMGRERGNILKVKATESGSRHGAASSKEGGQGGSSEANAGVGAREGQSSRGGNLLEGVAEHGTPIEAETWRCPSTRIWRRLRSSGDFEKVEGKKKEGALSLYLHLCSSASCIAVMLSVS